MVALRGSAAEVKRTRDLAGAVFAVFAAGAGVAQAAGAAPWLRIAFAAIAAVGGIVALALLRLVQAAERREEQGKQREQAAADERARAARLRTRLDRFGTLSAYALGVDHEAISSGAPGAEAAGYLPRDRDRDLRVALDSAAETGRPGMIVVRGPSKAGKSRTLFEAVRGHPRLAEAWTVAPIHREALAEALEPSGLPELGLGPLVIWLDDLELFVGPARGMHAGLLDALAGWERRVVVVATSGGKGAEQLAESRLAVPIEDLYRHPAVKTIPLSPRLSTEERAEARARYEPEVAAQVVEHGIGEYLVAAPELERKLDEERHRPGEASCPEGAAVVWAAIDWARMGMTTAIPQPLLREVWPNYLRGRAGSDDRFTSGLSWALRPLYGSISLVEEALGGYRAYDYIAAYADQHHRREINPDTWDRVLDLADPESAFQLGAVAYVREDAERCERAFARAEASTDSFVAGLAALNLGVVLEQRGDGEGALTAYRRADDRGSAGGANNLGVLLQERGDREGALASYRRADDRGLADASYNLAMLLEEQGDEAEALAAYRRADERGHAAAATSVGVLLMGRGDEAEALAAWRRADELGSAAGSLNLARLLAQRGEGEGALQAYRRADERGHPEGAHDLGVLLWEAW
jgi:tetratricopeptide (TPR) repeat protein